MKNKLIVILTVTISVLAIAFIVYAANSFPTTLNDWDDGDIIESGWADSIEDAIGVTGSLVQTSLDWKVRRARSFDIRVSGGSFARVSSLSFDAGMFNISNTASRSDITLDWTNGPASRSANESITGNWVNTTNPWADNEVIDTLTINGGVVTWTDLTTYPSACSAGQFVSTIGDTVTCGTPSATTAAAGFIEARNSGGTFVGVGSLSFDASHFTFSNTASDGYLRIDWGSGGPASLSEAETISGNWVNTASPWADNEVSDDLTIVSSTFTGSNSFAGSLNISKSLTVTNSVAAGSGEFTGYASAGFFDGNAFSGVGDCNDDGEAIGWSGGLFICNTLQDADIPDTITLSGGTIGANNISGTQTTTGTLTLGDNGDDIIIDSNDWDVSAAGVFSGLTGITSSGAALFTGSLDVPSSAGGSLVDAEGELTVSNTSASLAFYDGTAERVLRDRECKTWAYEDPTARSEWGSIFFDDPVTITDVTAIASRSSNAVGWNMTHGRTGSVLGTNLFTLNKSASSTFTYTSTFFNDATLTDSEFLVLRITSASATVEELDVTVCYRVDAAP